jgi:hypothetical protein
MSTFDKIMAALAVYVCIGVMCAEACARQGPPAARRWGVFAGIVVFWLPGLMSISFGKAKK